MSDWTKTDIQPATGTVVFSSIYLQDNLQTVQKSTHSTIIELEMATPTASSALARALRQLDITKVRLVLSRQKTDLNLPIVFRGNQKTVQIMTPFQYACKRGHVDILRELLAENQVPGGADCFCCSSPLYIACNHPDEDVSLRMATDLLACDASVDYTWRDGATPLMAAVIASHSKVVKLLCENDADVNFVSSRGEGISPLVYAIRHGNIEIMQTLLDYGADLHYVSTSGISPLTAAVLHGNVDAIAILSSSGADINEQCYGQNKTPPLLLACRLGETATANELVRYGADVNLKNIHGDSPIHYACLYADESPVDGLKLAKMLINHPKCDIDNKNINKETPTDLVLERLERTSRTILEGNNVDMYDQNCDNLRLAILCECFGLLVSAGCKIGQMAALCKTYPHAYIFLEQKGLIEHAKSSSGAATLKHISKLTVRHLFQQPMEFDLQRIGLPARIQQYVSLDYID